MFGLLLKTILISVMMTLLCCLPLFIKKMGRISHYTFLAGTGALLGICVLDLLPDVIELGGSSSLYLALAVWIAYSLMHLLQHRHQHRHEKIDHCHYHHAEGKSIAVFLASMFAHCFSSGILLDVSVKFNDNFSRAVFLALIAHKFYESLIVSSIILDRVPQFRKRILCILIYASGLPLGVAIAAFFNAQINNQIAILATSVALGSLFGCMVFDFLIPAILQIRKKWFEIGWVVLGFILTELFMHSS